MPRKMPARASLTHLTGCERTFSDHELIVSKTDLKGHITYANPLFVRLAGYPESQIIGAPHCLIRHPHMPASVFKLLWDSISAEKEIFAYVINRSANGDHYWVLAHVTPSYDERGKLDGYHSNRRVANPAVLKNTIIPLYSHLQKEEEPHTNAKDKCRVGLSLLQNILNEKKVSYEEFIFSLVR